MSKRSQRIVNSSLLKKNKTSNSIALEKPNPSHEYKFFKPRQLFKSATSGVDKNNEVILSPMIQPTQSLLEIQNVSEFLVTPILCRLNGLLMPPPYYVIVAVLEADKDVDMKL
ncbi:hypothetical protein ACI65C_003910 [Semiaphis heraclei]